MNKRETVGSKQTNWRHYHSSSVCKSQSEFDREIFYTSDYGKYVFWNTVSQRYLKPNTADQKLTETASCDIHKISYTYETHKCSKFHNFFRKNNCSAPDFLYVLLVRLFACFKNFCLSARQINIKMRDCGLPPRCSGGLCPSGMLPSLLW